MAPEKNSEEELPRTGGRYPSPVFWKELYWFVVILLGAWAAAVWVLGPRLARNRIAADREAQLRANLARLSKLEREIEAAIAALENDPYYREAVYRAVLGLRKETEIPLKSREKEADNERRDNEASAPSTEPAPQGGERTSEP